MAERLTIARPYAKAVFVRARDTGRLAAWSERLGLAAAISADARVRALYGDPRVDSKDLVTLFTGVGGAAFDEEAERFLAVLAENRRLQYLPEIAAVFAQLRAEHERVLDVTVTAAVELSPALRERLGAALQRRFGREIRLHTALDPALLGGAVIRADDLVIDGSLTAGLAQLARQAAGEQ